MATVRPVYEVNESCNEVGAYMEDYMVGDITDQTEGENILVEFETLIKGLKSSYVDLKQALGEEYGGDYETREKEIFLISRGYIKELKREINTLRKSERAEGEEDSLVRAEAEVRRL